MGDYNVTKASEMKGATVSNVVKAISHIDFGFTAGILATAEVAVITARTEGVMITWDGTDPTATLGHLIDTTMLGPFVLKGRAKINALKFLREAAADTDVTITLEQF